MRGTRPRPRLQLADELQRRAEVVVVGGLVASRATARRNGSIASACAPARVMTTPIVSSVSASRGASASAWSAASNASRGRCSATKQRPRCARYSAFRGSMRDARDR